MKESKLYKKLKNKAVQCLACNHKCVIPEGGTGICGVRKNINGKLYSLVYAKPIAVNIDPIEKKPLFHFLPGTPIFSIGTLGCNFLCKFCQNWDISQIRGEAAIKTEKSANLLSPKEIIAYCKEKNIPSIAYTYNEPTVFIDYAHQTMKLAKKEGLKNVWVSNGYFSDEAIKLVSPYLDAINIDLKSFSEKFYREIVGAKLEPVKENIKKIHKLGIWLEVTTLIIPGYNDSEEELSKIAKFIKKISPDIPWHISAFYPAFKMKNVPPTPKKALVKAYQIGREAGLNYVYAGNMPDSKYESTYCPKCGKLLIERYGFEILGNYLEGDKCPNCGFKVAGIFK